MTEILVSSGEAAVPKAPQGTSLAGAVVSRLRAASGPVTSQREKDRAAVPPRVEKSGRMTFTGPRHPRRCTTFPLPVPFQECRKEEMSEREPLIGDDPHRRGKTPEIPSENPHRLFLALTGNPSSHVLFFVCLFVFSSYH